MQTDLFEIGGTKFRFPATLPADHPDYGRGHAMADARREKILTAARKVKPTKRRTTRVGPPKAGDGSFVPAPGDPGSRVRLSDGREGEVWSRAPGTDRWVVLDDGAVVRIGNPTGKWKYGPTAEITGEDQRWCVVAGVIEARADFIATRLVGRPATLGGAESLAWVSADRAARAWAAAQLRHELYPAYWTAPAPFVDPRAAVIAA